jgi:hypothetical protein
MPPGSEGWKNAIDKFGSKAQFHGTALYFQNSLPETFFQLSAASRLVRSLPPTIQL